eukprot:COSAG04_NODE_22087_length_361_cov_1.000000_2_plen_86_part_01
MALENRGKMANLRADLVAHLCKVSLVVQGAEVVEQLQRPHQRLRRLPAMMPVKTRHKNGQDSGARMQPVSVSLRFVVETYWRVHKV